MIKNEIDKAIKSHYPFNIKYGTKEYFESNEHKKYLKKIVKEDTKLLQFLQNLFPNKVTDFSSAEYPCYEYIILLKETTDSINTVKQEIYLYISKLCNCYYYYILKTQSSFQEDDDFVIIHNFDDFKSDIALLDNFLVNKGYKKISNQHVCKKINFVETELHEMPTIFHLLFTDLYDNYR